MIAQIAQVAADNPLTSFGLAGIVIAWLFWFFDKLRGEIKMLAHRIDGMTRALLIDIISRDGIGVHAKVMAQQELEKIEARTKKTET